MYKLEKDIKLYKNQFERFLLKLYGDYSMERLSIDLDSILFRIKYMIKKDKDLSSLSELKEEFIEKALKLRNTFGVFMYNFLIQIVGLNDFTDDAIVDIISKDVKIDTIYLEFTMVVISSNREYLNYINDTIEDDIVFNMFPNEFFRFFVDSYNDGISKAYPELFANREQTEIGTGNDSDVFVHNLTLQTNEDCSLNCTYCLAEGTKILMEDFTYKNIEDIFVGDTVMGFEEFTGPLNQRSMIPTRVTKTMYRTVVELHKIISDRNGDTLYVTGEHPVLTGRGEWKMVKDLTFSDQLMTAIPNTVVEFTNVSFQKIPVHRETKVYNLETEEHTYIAQHYLVHNCYQTHKTPAKMTFDIAKEFIDNLLNDKYGYINRYNSPAIIIEFIGGEPLLSIRLIRQVYEYFLDRTYEMDHQWFKLHRLSICSNGLSYFNDGVQSFFKDYSNQISFNISIDGNKELHDACRIQPNGEGSYDIGMVALNHYNKHYSPERNSKMTLAPQNMKYLFESVKNFIENDMKTINLNCVFEEGWDQETALLEYNELKKVADYIVDNDLENIYISIFDERQEDIQDSSFDGNPCGGAGSMLALRPNGQFYPCIRYMPTSVGNNVDDLCIGTVTDGMIGRQENSKVLKILDACTRRSSSNDICYNCPIGSSCMHCIALSHTVYGTPNKKTMFTCLMTIAEALANNYFWQRLSLKHPEYNLPVRKNNVPDNWSRLIISEEELENLKLLECAAMVSLIERESE